MPVNVSNLEEMVYEFIINTIKEKYPELDTTDNSPIVDLLVKPLQVVVEPLIKHLNSMEFMMNLDNAEYMTEEELDKIGEGNYMVSRNPGDKALGEVVFSFSSVSDTENLIVPEGVTVATNDGLRYKTTEAHEFTPQELYSYYNPSTFLYEIPVAIEAEDVGEEYNVGEGRINTIINSFSINLKSVTNKAPITGGTNKETNKEYAERIRQFYISRQLGTKPGYKQFILENFSEIKDVYVAGYGDSIMTRDEAEITIDSQTYTGHIGGKVDIYVRGSNTQTESITTTCRSNNLPLSMDNVDTLSIQVENTNNPGVALEYTTSTNANGKVVVTVPETSSLSQIQWSNGDTVQVTYDYTDDQGQPVTGHTESFTIDRTIITPKAPLTSVLSIVNDSTGENYDLSSDPGVVYNINYLNDTADYAGTSKEEPEVEFIETNAENGQSITVTYSYNETINSLSQLFDQEENRIITTDMLFTEASPVYIYIGMKVKLKENQTADSAKSSAIRNTLIEYFDEIDMGSRIEESDIISKLYMNETIASFIEYIELPLLTFHKAANSSESYAEGVRDGTYIQFNTVEYPVLHICEITYI